jgi:hypothetical protein
MCSPLSVLKLGCVKHLRAAADARIIDREALRHRRRYESSKGIARNTMFA